MTGSVHHIKLLLLRSVKRIFDRVEEDQSIAHDSQIVDYSHVLVPELPHDLFDASLALNFDFVSLICLVDPSGHYVEADRVLLLLENEFYVEHRWHFKALNDNAVWAAPFIRVFDINSVYDASFSHLKLDLE